MLSEYEFVVRAINKLRKPGYKGIHSVYSGFNQAFREYFNKDPVEATRSLAEAGKIVTQPVKGGAMLYLPEEAPKLKEKQVLEAVLSGERLPEQEFVRRAILKLRKPPYKGIHSVYSGFNQAFREYFSKDPVEATTRLVEAGKIVTKPAKGGAMLYLPEDAPSKMTNALGKILEDEKDQLEILGPAEDE
jgi:hypothetical protein